MNMKAILFAGTGLFLSMSATAIWIGNDMADIKAREKAKHDAACAAVAAQATPISSTGATQATGVDPVTGMPVTAAGTAATGSATPTTNVKDCPTNGGTAGQQTGQAVDPNTGQQLNSDAATVIDPATGQPIAPAATAPTGTTDPNAGTFDPNTGQPLTDTSVAPVDGSTGTTDPSFAADGSTTPTDAGTTQPAF